MTVNELFSDQTNSSIIESNGRTPTVDNGETPTVGDRENPAVDNREIPTVDNGETPTPDNRETPAVDNRETPTLDNRETPTVVNDETPTIGDRETPTTDNPQDLESEVQSTESQEETGPFFQAVGIITGKLDFQEERNTITIGRITYPLFYIPKKRRVFDALKKEVENTGESTQRLVVYPKITHFPKKEQPHQIAFQLVGFDKGREEEGISGELQDMEFKLCGLWQFIPVCSTPCISVFRNFSDARLQYIKQAEPNIKVKFMKASHVPVFWKDAPVRPFRFNPKAEGDQGRPAFVEIKAKFIPSRGTFGFDALLAPPQEKAPKFLKASKQDKATVMAAAREKAKAEGTKPAKPQGNKKHIKPVPKKRENT
ncbi:MAG: hypothetical protein SAK29_02905 [Scytonema sp. PMC 1069.18]|nr:hypothetical protein [Scytonema sp. PMC 1069.18]MEC4881059.1 hypothetical protein [Scytonema sp. PMC 1070.18]